MVASNCWKTDKDCSMVSQACLKSSCQAYFYLAMVWKVFKGNDSLMEHLDLIAGLLFVFVFLNLLLHFPAGLIEAQRRQDTASSHKANLYSNLNLKGSFCLFLKILNVRASNTIDGIFTCLLKLNL